MRHVLPLLMTTALITTAVAADNPLLRPWAGPFGGVPPFDQASPALLAPALEEGMALHLQELQAIADNPVPPTFENTIAAMERSGRALDRAATVYYIYGSTLSDDAVQQVERDIEPKLAAFRDRITQNEKLFKRIAAVYATRESAGLTPEQQRLTWLVHNNFVRAGAKLDASAKQRLAAINQSLAGLFTRFSQNLLADESERFLVLQSEADLAGLPESLRAGFAADAERRGQKGKWIVANTRSSVEPFLTYSTRRELREKVWRTFVNRGDNGDARDNNALIGEILQLRAERAGLLGYATHAHWRLEDSMARTPERAMELMEAVWKPAVLRVREEVADMQKLADAESAGIRIEPWDYRYYAEKVRKAKYDLDTNELKPYLQLEKLREGMFYVAGELFGMRFSELAAGTVPVYHPDVRVWRVDDAAGKLVGLWYFDPYARVGKQSGAWMNAYRNQERFDGAVTTIVSNNSNFVKGKPGEPVLISWDDAVTLFHEFGHALHGLSSNVTYPSVSGTNVARLRRVPLATARALAARQGSARPLRRALPDRQAHSCRTRREGGAGEDLQPGFRHGRVPLGRPDRHEAAFGGAQGLAHRCRRVRARNADFTWHAQRNRHAASHAAVRSRVLGRRLFRGLLQLSVGRYAHRRRLGRFRREQGRVGQGRCATPPR